MDHTTLDAVLPWLDTGSLVAAGGVCRAWRGLAAHPETWRPRPFPLRWGCDATPRDAWIGSLNAEARWRRGRWATRRLPHAPCDPGVWCDGDWLAFVREHSHVERRGLSVAVCTGRRLEVYDMAAAGAGAGVGVDEGIGAEAAECVASVPLPRDFGYAVAALSQRAALLVTAAEVQREWVCTAWRVRDGKDARFLALDAAHWTVRELHWRADGELLVLCTSARGGGVGGAGLWGVRAHGDGDLRVAWTCELPPREHAPSHSTHLAAQPADPAYLFDYGRVYAVDGRCAAPPPPLFEHDRLKRCDRMRAFADGRRVAVLRSHHEGSVPAVCDARAATVGGIYLVARQHGPNVWTRDASAALAWTDLLCETSRATMLCAGWTHGPHASRDKHTVVAEWSPDTGRTEALLVIDHSNAGAALAVSCADERRLVLAERSRFLYVLDATRSCAPDVPDAR